MNEIFELIKENIETIILSIIAIYNSVQNIKHDIRLRNTPERKQKKLAKQLKNVENQELIKVNEIKNLEIKKEQLKNEITSIKE